MSLTVSNASRLPQADAPPRTSACQRIGNGARVVASGIWEGLFCGFVSNGLSWAGLRSGKIPGEVLIGLVDPSRKWRAVIRGLSAALGTAAFSKGLGFSCAVADVGGDLLRDGVNQVVKNKVGVEDYLFTVYSPVTHALLTLAYTGAAGKGAWDDISAALGSDPRDTGMLSIFADALYTRRSAMAAGLAVGAGFFWSYLNGAPKAPPLRPTFDDFVKLAAARSRGAKDGTMRWDVLVASYMAAVLTGGDSGLLLDEHPTAAKVVGSFLSAYAIYAICHDWYSRSRLFAKGLKPAELAKAKDDMLKDWGMEKTRQFLVAEINDKSNERERFPVPLIGAIAETVNFFLCHMAIVSMMNTGKGLKPSAEIYDQMLNPTVTQKWVSFAAELVLQGAVMLLQMRRSDGKNLGADERMADVRGTMSVALGALAECVARYSAITGAGARGALQGLAGGATMRALPHVAQGASAASRWCRGGASVDRKDAAGPDREAAGPQPQWDDPSHKYWSEMTMPFITVWEQLRFSCRSKLPVAGLASVVPPRDALREAAVAMERVAAQAGRANVPPEDVVFNAELARALVDRALAPEEADVESRESKVQRTRIHADRGPEVELGLRVHGLHLDDAGVQLPAAAMPLGNPDDRRNSFIIE